MVHRSSYKSGVEILRKKLKSPRKRLRRLWKNLKVEENEKARGSLAKEIETLHAKIEGMEKDLKIMEYQEQERARQKEKVHKVSGLASMTAREVAGGLPSLGKKI